MPIYEAWGMHLSGMERPLICLRVAGNHAGIERVGCLTRYTPDADNQNIEKAVKLEIPTPGETTSSTLLDTWRETVLHERQ